MIDTFKTILKRASFRLIRIIGRLVYRRRIWLVSDRSSMAGDNGEAFFRFLQNTDVDSIFAIKKDSADYEKIKNIGNIVEYESLMYKFLLCVCDCHCSSQLIHMENHREAPQIFLQHGVAEKSIAKMLNPASHKNLFVVTSANREYEMITGNEYSISAENVWLTGIPRFDYLNDNCKKKIVIAFTWRAVLVGCSKDDFSKSYYYKAIAGIMKNEALGKLVSDYGYELLIKLHPEMNSFKDCLPVSETVSFFTGTYNSLYEEASLMITDYSSSIFDFVYLRKPIIYYQFDDGAYFKENPYLSKGNFSYEEDGFGPVVYNEHDFEKSLKKMLQNDCEMEEMYKKRADKFFAFNDKNNCERIYQKIKSII